MKIQRKLTLCFLFVSLLAVAVGLIAHWQLTKIANPLRGEVYASVEQLDQALANNDRAQRIRYANEVRFQSVHNYAFTGERRFVERYYLSHSELTELLRLLSRNNPFPIEIFQNDLSLAVIEQEAIQKVGNGQRSHAISMLEDPAYENLKNQYEKILRGYFESIGASYEKAHESAVVNVRLATEQTDKIIRDSIRLNLIMVFVLVGIAVGISIKLGRSIAAPILRLTGHVAGLSTGLSEGRSHEELPLSSKDEIGDLTRAFSKMTHDLQKTMAARGEAERDLIQRGMELTAANLELEAFTYTVSHDLRAPVRALLGYSGILVEEYADKFDAEGRRLLSVLREESTHIGNLIDDLLAFSRLGRSELKRAHVDMNGLVGAVVEHLRKGETYGHVAVTILDLPPTFGDLVLLRQVFINLIGNAFKFTEKKTEAVVTIGSQPSQDEFIYFVADNGVGFDMRYVHKLFGVFQRLHTIEEFPGTGVGLAIVQRIIQKHGGRVWAESKIGEGATFYVGHL